MMSLGKKSYNEMERLKDNSRMNVLKNALLRKNLEMKK